MNVTTIGSALVDIFITSPNFKIDSLGELSCKAEVGKLEVDNFMVRTGGGASNTAASFARMGFEVKIMAELGKDEFAQLVVADLEKEGIKTDFLIQERRESTGGSVILVAEDGQRLVLVHRGAASMLDPQDILEGELIKSDWIHVSHLGDQPETLKHIFRIAREHKIKVSWNPGMSFLNKVETWPIDEVEATVLVLNKQEWEVIAAHQAAFLEKIPEVVITDSVNGADIFLNGKFAFHADAQPVTAVDNTGAGDAFVSAYSAARLYGHEPQTAAAWGTKNAASVVQQVGAKPGLLGKIVD